MKNGNQIEFLPKKHKFFKRNWSKNLSQFHAFHQELENQLNKTN